MRMMLDMDDDAAPAGVERTLRYLKWLVTALTLTMIFGLLTIVVLFVMRFNEMNRLELPEEVVLPDGVRATAYTRGEGWFAIVTDNDEILIFDGLTGGLQQRVQLVVGNTPN